MDVIANPSQRTLCVLVLDSSGSMETSTSNGLTRIQELNNGIEILRKELLEDHVAADRVALAIITVGGPLGGANLLMDFTDIREFKPFKLTASGTTPLGDGMIKALEVVENGKQLLKNQGIGYLRPWIMVITDGEPTDSESTWKKAVSESIRAESSRKCTIYPIAVDGGNTQRLSELTTAPVQKMSSIKFNELFQWLSASLSSVSSSAPGATVQLPSTDPWAGVKL